MPMPQDDGCQSRNHAKGGIQIAAATWHMLGMGRKVQGDDVDKRPGR